MSEFDMELLKGVASFMEHGPGSEASNVVSEYRWQPSGKTSRCS